MKIERKKMVLWQLERAEIYIKAASRVAGPVDDAHDEDVELCIHIGNAMEDLRAAKEELK